MSTYMVEMIRECQTLDDKGSDMVCLAAFWEQTIMTLYPDEQEKFFEQIKGTFRYVPYIQVSGTLC